MWCIPSAPQGHGDICLEVAPCESSLFDDLKDCAPIPVQGDGVIELIFKPRGLENIKQQLAP